MLRFDGKSISNVLYKDVHLNYTGVVETRMQWFLIKMPSPKMDNAFPSFPSPVFSLVKFLYKFEYKCTCHIKNINSFSNSFANLIVILLKIKV